MIYENFIALALLAATSVVAGFFGYIYSLKRQSYLLLWTAGWTLFAVHHLGPALPPGIQGRGVATSRFRLRRQTRAGTSTRKTSTTSRSNHGRRRLRERWLDPCVTERSSGPFGPAAHSRSSI